MSQSIRLRTEEHEFQRLSPLAAKSAEARRAREEVECSVRTRFQRDRDRILHSKPFRRLKHKTQVYIAPVGDHYRTRMTHSLEVAQICRTIGRALSLNEDLIEAISLGHDVGHTPFGHVGEETLASLIGHFEHNEQSVRIYTVLTGNGEGLNLTEQVLDGILHHTGPGMPNTLEGQIVRIGDRIAYLCHDFDDALRAEILSVNDLPATIRKEIGSSTSEMITTMVLDMIQASEGKDTICQSAEISAIMKEFRDFMFERVYYSSSLQEERSKSRLILGILFDYYLHHPEILPEDYLRWTGGDLKQAITDYVAGLTDNYAISIFKHLFIPKE
ncbi:MAG: deoxyguanosinetriphosphate triphosphohydrolase [Dehalobacter sp. 4CP]|uniref:deoxyguanosinetriphosphate triphosphohydrolase n=1 Tax=unclassified Dehalobacter TaxID=2635733 RepID=UPI00028BBDFD|nr:MULTISPECIES: deoxyguanosinetriphosphate triphosphohydrolase [unclassified Dehalobacter]MCM1566612.1 deoxyguanosinetriphosphate triphosphohydrolase [Dehalobacter sp.]NBJ16856.1 deoxyguanosinetriphosphate triphosphohydrolase [Dehalobacter sp. 4CP]AFV03558.1 Deoxyguanosinetriphosphate triphosphohydrolase [Dehalobacter sp. DCA]AFV06543.1 Deoxyguanosinetriphosphate triphosphohydrolase [Dehalobacter sp. CF]EQB20961.1 Deoxyguanosinetriphosphate triphosphohydrolase [Dehalobacter sp. UNSWDHB]